MSEMVERVAKALHDAMPGLVHPEAWPWRTLARAVIAAMREPTEAMFVTGDERVIETLNDMTFALKEPTLAQKAWQAMIDQALTPEMTGRRITTVYRFGNGMVMVFDQHGEQMPDFQGPAEECVPRVRAAGFMGPIEAGVWR